MTGKRKEDEEEGEEKENGPHEFLTSFLHCSRAPPVCCHLPVAGGASKGLTVERKGDDSVWSADMWAVGATLLVAAPSGVTRLSRAPWSTEPVCGSSGDSFDLGARCFIGTVTVGVAPSFG